jgi:hypothetical protein
MDGKGFVEFERQKVRSRRTGGGAAGTYLIGDRRPAAAAGGEGRGGEGRSSRGRARAGPVINK